MSEDRMTTNKESEFILHARTELELAGLFDGDSDYHGMLGPCVMEILEVFARQGHSGYSVMMTLDLVNRLIHHENLTSLTSDPDEWIDHTEISGGNPTYQNKRNSKAFSEDGGQTYYLLDEEPRVMHEAEVRHV